jgi:hypothetical protein
MKYAWTFFYLLLFLSFATFNISSSAGAANRICASCHFGATDVDSGSLFIVNLPSGYAHNTVYPLELCVVDTDQIAAGFRLEASIGSLSIPQEEQNAQIMSGEATHNKRTLLVHDTACWKVNWMAPLSGNEETLFTFRANAVNFDFTNQGDHGGYFMQASGGVLPVQLLQFEAIALNTHIQINWSTTQEVNNAAFELLRSTNRDSWELLTTVNGSGNSSELIEYSYADHNPLPGTSLYKLRQIDYDGSYYESRVIKVYFKENHLSRTVWTIGETITIDHFGVLTLYDITGRRLSHSNDGRLMIPIVSPGIYLLSSSISTQKIWIRQ